mgnify:CR=1 FL=1
MLRAPMLRALAATATGLTLRADGDSHAALQSLRQAASLWTELRAPYELARARVEIAEACRASATPRARQLEIDAALATSNRSGAVPDAARLGRAAGAGELTSRGRSTSRRRGREVDREIAAALVISERTVERHVSNIFAKLASSPPCRGHRAYAYEH